MHQTTKFKHKNHWHLLYIYNMNVRLTDKQKVKISGSDDIFEVMRHILLRDNKVDRDKEHFWLICLAANNLISNIELVSLGSVDSTVVKPMNVFRIAVMKGAVKVILCHNHPSGGLVPSEGDKDMTDRLSQVGKILNIEVVDHLIITTKTYMSFADTGLMDKIGESTKWVPNYKLAEEIRKEEADIRRQAVKEAREKATKKKAVETAKVLKAKGIDINIIVEASGLSKEEIEKLRV